MVPELPTVIESVKVELSDDTSKSEGAFTFIPAFISAPDKVND